MAAAPPGYMQAVAWSLSGDWRRLIAVNVLGLSAIAPAAALVGAVWVAVRGPGEVGPLARDLFAGDRTSAVWLVVSLAICAVLHELTHGLAIRACGNRPTYGFAWKGLVPYATAPGQFFSRNRFVMVALAPLLGLTVAGAAALAFAPSGLEPWIAFGMVTNVIGATGDCWLSLVVLRYPRSARVLDERDGVRIFVPRAD